MNARHCFFAGFAVFFLLISLSHGLAQDQAATLAVKKMVVKTQKSGEEKITILCSQACVPALSVLEGNKPRVIMDFSGVSSIEPKYRNIPLSGKSVKKIRSYLDPSTNKLRVVLDMSPSRAYVVHPAQDQAAGTYSLVISEKRPAKGKYAKKSQAMKAGGISIVDQGLRPMDKELKPAETAVKQASLPVESPMEDKVSVERGRSQMNAGNYAGAVNTFTELIAKNPKDSLSYRLRGNAYQNMGDQQKAVGDWITSARLGNEIVRSYLDYMQINWKETPKP